MNCPHCNRLLSGLEEAMSVCPDCGGTINRGQVECYCIHCHEAIELSYGVCLYRCPRCEGELYGIYLVRQDIISAYCFLAHYLEGPEPAPESLLRFNKQTLFFMFLNAYRELNESCRQSSPAGDLSLDYVVNSFSEVGGVDLAKVRIYSGWRGARRVLAPVNVRDSIVKKSRLDFSSFWRLGRGARNSITSVTEPLAFVMKYYLPPEFTGRAGLNVLLVGPGSNEYLESYILARMFPQCSYTSIDHGRDLGYNERGRSVHPFVGLNFTSHTSITGDLQTLLPVEKNNFDLVIINHPRPGNSVIFTWSVELLKLGGYLIIKPFGTEEHDTKSFIKAQATRVKPLISSRTIKIPDSRIKHGGLQDDDYVYIIQKISSGTGKSSSCTIL